MAAKKRSAKKPTAAKKTSSKRVTKKKSTSGKKSGVAKKRTSTTAKKPAARKRPAKSETPASAPRIDTNRPVKGVTKVEYSDACKRLVHNSGEIARHRTIVHEVFDKYHDQLFSHPDVCGLHIGLKRSQGMVCYPLRYCIRLHVRKKWPEKHPMLQTPIDVDQFKHLGVELDIIERSYQNIAASSPPYPGSMIGARPIAPNMDPNHWGTMGMVVFTMDGLPRYLTNKHVAGEPGTEIRESAYGKTFSGETQIIGEVESSLRNTRVDCAIIKPKGKRAISEGIMKPDATFGLLPGKYTVRKLTAIDEHNTEVFKIGASTGFQPVPVGIVKNVNTSIEINGMLMTGQIIVESKDAKRIVDGGDSGSVAIVKGRDAGGPINFVVGLVHAEALGPAGETKGDAMVANHFDEVQSALRIKLFQG